VHITTKSFCGDRLPVPGTTFEWHTKMVAYLMNAAKGDLMLDNHGNLTTRDVNDYENFKELPFSQHRQGQLLAVIGSEGWLLTRAGASFLIENCPPERKSDLQRLYRVVVSGSTQL
jgi:hypothetical protein